MNLKLYLPTALSPYGVCLRRHTFSTLVGVITNKQQAFFLVGDNTDKGFTEFDGYLQTVINNLQ